MAEPPAGRVRVAVIISGRGSNMAALIDAARAADHPYTVALVVSDRADAPGLALAAARGVPTRVIPRRSDRGAFEAELDATLRAERIDLVALAGFMRILGADFVRRWEGRLLNIHPSLLPRHKGLDTHARALAAGDAETGCTVHLVTPDLDAGPILAQARVPILPYDTPETLAERVRAEEHRLYPEALAAYALKLPRG